MNDVILMSQTDCAQCLGTTPRTIRRWISQGLLDRHDAGQVDYLQACAVKESASAVQRSTRFQRLA